MIQALSNLSHSGFFIGASLGLAAALLLWIFGLIRRARLRRELKRLTIELRTHLDISARSTRTLKERIGELKHRNRNLQEAVDFWEKKPQRTQIRELLVCEEALAALKARIPGFIQVWEQAHQEAEEEVIRANRGLMSLFRQRRPDPKTPKSSSSPNHRLPADSES